MPAAQTGKGELMFEERTTDGQSAAVEVEGYTNIIYQGDFNGGTAQLQLSRDKAVWIDVLDSDFTANAAFTIFTGKLWIRTDLNGTSAAADFTSAAVPAPLLGRN